MTQEILIIEVSGELKSVDVKAVMPDFKRVSARSVLTTEQQDNDPGRHIISKATAPVELVTCASNDPEAESRQFIAIKL